MDPKIHTAVQNCHWEEVRVLLDDASTQDLHSKNLTLIEAALLHNAPADIISQLISPHNINMQDEDGNTVLLEAVSQKRWDLVPVLLQHGADVNLGNDKTQSPLHWALYHGAPTDIITQLISPHNINMQERYSGITALHWVVSRKSWALVRVLLQHGADINIANCQQETPLHRAACHDVPTDIISQLISTTNINMQDEDGHSPLHQAVEKERWHLVSVLLQHEADVNLSNGNKETPLHCAAFVGAPADIFPRLISPHNINIQDKYGKTALLRAVITKSWDLVPILLQHGADINLENLIKETPLHRAVCHHAPTDILSQLISPTNINMQNEDGYTAIHWAVSEKSWDLVPVLLQHRADVNVANHKIETPLHCAVNHGASTDIITRLISPHNINMQDIKGFAALHRAVIKEQRELVPVLLQRGADINLANWKKDTPLHLAAFLGAPADIITVLISPHNIDMQNENGDTVFHDAVRKQSWDLVPVLLQHRADINRVNCKKETPLHRTVCYHAPTDIISQLISPTNINMQDEGGNSPLHQAVRKGRWELVPVLLQYGADPFMCDLLTEPQKPHSLQSLCIATIRSHIMVKSDEAFERLGLPQRILPELKLKPLADEIIAAKQRHDSKFCSSAISKDACRKNSNT